MSALDPVTGAQRTVLQKLDVMRLAPRRYPTGWGWPGDAWRASRVTVEALLSRHLVEKSRDRFGNETLKLTYAGRCAASFQEKRA